jgi:hypothetical protein
MLKHYMLDIETLGLEVGSVVLQVAMRQFLSEDEDGKYVVDYGDAPYLYKVDVDLQIAEGATTNIDTIRWWLQTDAQKLQKMLDRRGAVDPLLCASVFNHHIDWQNAVVWARDPDFDCTHMIHFCATYLKEEPKLWHFAAQRSHRTLLDLAGVKHVPAQNAHDALEDVDAQIESAIRALKVLCPNKFT